MEKEKFDLIDKLLGSAPKGWIMQLEECLNKMNDIIIEVEKYSDAEELASTLNSSYIDAEELVSALNSSYKDLYLTRDFLLSILGRRMVSELLKLNDVKYKGADKCT